MTIYNWSDLNPGDVFGQDTLASFDPAADQLVFDDPAFSAADVLFDGNDAQSFFSLDGKFITLDIAPFSITTVNITFADGSQLIVGDNTTAVPDTATGGADDGPNTITGTNFDDLLVGAGGSDSVFGSGGNDVIAVVGDVPNNLYGSDTLNGGANDTTPGGGDTLVYIQPLSGVTVQLSGATPSSATGGDGVSTLTLISIENVIGTDFNDSIVGSNGANRLEGGAGNDTLAGGGANDTGNDTLIGGDGDDIVRQTRGQDHIDGSDGFNDRLEFTGNGITYGTGAGASAVSVDLGAGTSDADRLGNDSVNGAGGDVATLTGIEQVFGTAGSDILTGGSLARAASGTFSENFRGNAGDDTIDGDNGALGDRGVNDTVQYSNSTAAVVVNLGTTALVGDFYGAGVITVAGGSARDGAGTNAATGGGTDTLIDVNIVQGSGFDDTLVGGNPDNDTFERFEGRAGTDFIDGGSGTDEASYAASPFAVEVNLATGIALDGWDSLGGATDTLVSIERVRGSGSNDTLTGSGAEFELFIGEAGDDTIDGGGGDRDFASWQTSALTNGGINAFIENGSGTVADGFGTTDTLINIEGLAGTGSSDTLAGGQGDQWFRGRGGSDILDGGADSDTADYSGDPNAVFVDLAAGTATDGWGGIFDLQGTDTLISIENAIGTDFDDTLTGGEGDNYFDGDAGNDRFVVTRGISGFYGNDTLKGGEGAEDRVVFGDAGSGIVIDMGNGTIDGTITGGDGGSALTLQGIEAVSGTAFADVFNSNASIEVNGLRTDIIQRFEGGAGNDTLSAAMNESFTFGVTVIAEYRNDPGGIIVNLDQQNGEAVIVGNETIEAGTARDGYGDLDWLQAPSFGGPINVPVDGIVGSMHDDYIQGGAFANSVGGNSRQVFEGLGGNDTIIGGHEFGGSTVSYESSLSGVVVNLSSSMAGGGLDAHQASDGFGGTDTLQQIDAVRGSAHADTFIGGIDDEEHFEGMGGDDSINGGDHFDNAYYRYAGEAVLIDLGTGTARALDGTDETGTIGDDELVEIEAVHGSDFNDSIVGGGDGAQADEFQNVEPWEMTVFVGWEELEGLAGDDTIDGGDGPAGPGNPRDIALYVDSAGSVIVNLGSSTVGGVGPNEASDGFGGTDTLIDVDGAVGSRFDDTLVGGDGSDYFIGRQGNDSFVGGAGIDWISFDFGNSVNVNLNQGTATEFQGGPGGFVWVDTISGFENVVGSNDNDSIVGSTGANLLAGYEGNDTLSGGDASSGGGANDSLYGGEGNDILTQTRGSDHIDGGFGVSDRLQFSGFTYGGATAVNVDLGAGTSDANRDVVGHEGTVTNVEIVFGTAGDDILTGGSEARSSSDTFLEIFRGRGGNDTIDGAGGSGNVGRGWVDRVEYSSSVTGAVNVNLETGVAQDGEGGTDTLRNINWVVGSSFNDVLVGGNKANDFFERFEGRAGSDTIDGGSGVDDASYVASPSAVFVDLGAGIAFDGWGFTDALLGIERARGSNFNDTLMGSDRLDVIEVFIGEGGDDTIDGGDGIDFVSWRTLNIEAGGVNVVLGADTVNDGIVDDQGQTGIDKLIGIEGFDGSAADDTASGADGGNWWFRGRGGNDVLTGADGIDTADYSTDQLGVIVNLGSANVVVGAETVAGGTARDGFGGVFDNMGIDTLADIENVLGSIQDDHITGSAGDNVLDGDQGDDTLNGGDGADTLLGGSGDDSLDGGLGDDTLDGGSGNDVIAGGGGADLFIDSSGDDTLNGGDGADTFVVDYKGGSTNVRASGGNDGDMDVYVLNPDRTGSDYRVTDFDVGEDFIDVGALLDASATEGFYIGEDPIKAGFLRFRNDAGDAVLEWDRTGAGDGAQWVEVITLNGLGTSGLGRNAFLGFVQGGKAAETLAGGASDDVMLGLGGGDLLEGGDGDDQLFGGGGRDTMRGGEGNDVYHVDRATDKVEEPGSFLLMAAAAAVSSEIGDTIIAAIDYSIEALGAIEHLQLTGNAAHATGNSLANLLRGNEGNDTLVGSGGDDTLEGAAGADSMVGGTGDDTYVVDSAKDKVKETSSGGIDTMETSLTLGRELDANVEHLVLTGKASIDGTGNKLSNFITGNKGKNVLLGMAGNDTLDGAAGGDTLEGGAGDDLYIFGKGDKIRGEGATDGIDTVQSSVARGALEKNLEHVVLTGNLAIDASGNSAANQLTGNANDNLLNGDKGADTLIGGSGNDTLDGGVGGDSMSGGQGNDVFIVGTVNDVVIEADAEGTDTVQSSVDIAGLSDNVENLVLTGSALNGTGNVLGNSITGNDAGNVLSGGGDDDTLDGAGGVDTLLGGAGEDVLVWDAADGSFDGGEDDDVLRVLGSAQDIVLSAENIENIEIVDLTGSGANTLRLTSADVLALSSTTDTLFVNGDDGDAVHFDDAGWVQGSDSTFDSVNYHSFTKDGATLFTATAIDIAEMV